MLIVQYGVFYIFLLANNFLVTMGSAMYGDCITWRRFLHLQKCLVQQHLIEENFLTKGVLLVQTLPFHALKWF